jgi:hypothetical protein
MTDEKYTLDDYEALWAECVPSSVCVHTLERRL